MTGVVFDIKEFAVFDGPGVRTTAFMKGCPLRCQWCHNPEGLSMKPQLMVSVAACAHCGACAAHCQKEACDGCGACVPYCQAGLRRIAGQVYAADQLAQALLKGEKLMRQSGGGVTFSGGEPLMQWPFVKDVIGRLAGLDVAVETSGYASDQVFAQVMDICQLVIMDVKLIDPALHRRYCGVDNECILRHARMLRDGDTPFIIRVPLIPGVTDGKDNLAGVAQLIQGAKRLEAVELLPYHKTAGAKYPMAGMDYRPDFDTDAPVRPSLDAFESLGIPVRVL